MVKITYDLDNKEEVLTVEDYYFFKYHSKVILSEWQKFYFEETDDELHIANNSYISILDERALKIIYDNLDKTEFNMLKNIAIKYIYKGHYIPSDYTFLDALLCYNGRRRFIYRFRDYLIEEFGDNL